MELNHGQTRNLVCWINNEYIKVSIIMELAFSLDIKKKKLYKLMQHSAIKPSRVRETENELVLKKK